MDFLTKSFLEHCTLKAVFTDVSVKYYSIDWIIAFVVWFGGFWDMFADIMLVHHYDESNITMVILK